MRRFLPTRERMLIDRKYRWVRPLLDKPYLWHFRRHAVARGVAVGAFFSLFPFPIGLFIPSTLVTVRVRGNVPVSYAALWLSNPFTIFFHWWSAYVIGCALLRHRREHVDFHAMTWRWLVDHFWGFYLEVWVGSLVQSAAVASVAYVVINELWKAGTRLRWRRSRRRVAG